MEQANQMRAAAVRRAQCEPTRGRTAANAPIPKVTAQLLDKRGVHVRKVRERKLLGVRLVAHDQVHDSLLDDVAVAGGQSAVGAVAPGRRSAASTGTPAVVRAAAAPHALERLGAGVEAHAGRRPRVQLFDDRACLLLEPLKLGGAAWWGGVR